MIRISKRLRCLFAVGFLVLPLLPLSQEYNWAKIDEEAFEKNQPTEMIMDVIGIKAGMYVGEVGAGGGRVAVRVARRVGDTGRVFANDISESALAYMQERCVREKIQNMEVIKGTLTDPRFPRGKLDAVYLTFTYRHLDRPVDVLRNVAPALKPGGVLAVIESKSYNQEPAKNEIIKNAGLAGYTLVKLETFLPEDDIYIFQVPLPHSPGNGKGRQLGRANPAGTGYIILFHHNLSRIQMIWPMRLSEQCTMMPR